MRILYLHQYYCPPGGWGNNRSYDLSRNWAAAGHEVHVLTSPAYFPLGAVPQAQVIDGVQVRVLDVPYGHEMGYLRRIWAFVRFYWLLLRVGKRMPRPDLIYASSTPLTVGEAGRRLARHFRCPLVFETVDVWPDVPIGMGIIRNRLLIGLLNWATNRIYNTAAAIVTLSEGMAAQVASHGVAEQKIHVTHNGTDVEAFVPAAAPPPTPVRLLYAGTIGPANDVPALLRALHHLHTLAPELAWHCDILGWGKQQTQLAALVQALDLGKRVTLHPPVPKNQLPPWFQRAHVGLVTFAPYPVLEANSANKFFDYLACGLPVVTNYLGWQADYLHNWQAGLSAPQSDEATFAQHLLRLVQDAQLRAEIGHNARRLAAAHFDRKQIANRLLVLFEQISATATLP